MKIIPYNTALTYLKPSSKTTRRIVLNVHSLVQPMYLKSPEHDLIPSSLQPNCRWYIYVLLLYWITIVLSVVAGGHLWLLLVTMY